MRDTDAPPIAERLESLGRLVGNTPLLALRCRFRGHVRRVFAKAESLNLTGSIKDRMALHIVRRAHADGALSPGGTIVEATSGNTGISLAAVGRALGHPVRIFMPDWMSRERVDLIRSMGATVVAVSREEGGFLGSIRLAEAYAAERPGVFLPRQFEHPANADAHEAGTGAEIAAQLGAHRIEPAAFVAGVGTGGTVMGVARALRRRWPGVRIHPLEPAESPTLSTGHRVGRHRIQGISDEFVPPLLELDRLDAVLAVSDGDAILMAQKLASSLGLAVGISSGANFIGALMAQQRLGPDRDVVTVFADSNKKYLSTDLMGREAPQADHWSPEVELLGFTVLDRDCRMCSVNRPGSLARPRDVG